MQKKLLVVAAFLITTFIFSAEAANLATTSPDHNKTTPSVSAKEKASKSGDEEILSLYETFTSLNSSMPALETFSNGIKGYQKLKAEGEIKKEILTIVDFSLPSSQKRMWILDMNTNKVLYHTYVAHGKNTGVAMATDFSNTVNSFQSSLGFYMTAETYYGRNGLSLFIDGMEEGFNSNARQRYVVVHGADYATKDFIKKNGRLGRSLGCPAVPMEISKDIIHTIKGNSVLFIYHPSEEYLQNSKYLNAPAV